MTLSKPGILADILAIAALAGLIASAQSLRPVESPPLFYADLGPAFIDVSGYPKKQRANYALFAKTCSRCHTLARAVNSPTTDRKVWSDYVLKMRGISRSEMKPEYAEEEGRRIVDFLVYDSKVRKIRDRGKFEALTWELQGRFAQIIRENNRRLISPPSPGTRKDR